MKHKWLKRLFRILISVFILMNVVAIFHSYQFTHFSDNVSVKTGDPGQLSTMQKVRTLIFGVSNPRPQNHVTPAVAYETIKLQSNKEIECWYVKTDGAKGTVILFHGYGGKKSAMLDKAEVFRSMGYHTLLVDFMGSGGSEGNQTTIGYGESAQVKTCYGYVRSLGEANIYLFGTSMGAVAIMKAISEDSIQPKGIILECPFGTMKETVDARFRSMKVPTFPMAGLLMFWGGLQNGFWAFGHNPDEYAYGIKCPVLMLYGAKDERVSRIETDRIFVHLAGPKLLRVYPDAGHENYLNKYKEAWTNDVENFLNEH